MRKMIMAVLVAAVMAFSAGAQAQSPPFWQTYWMGFTGSDCSGSHVIIFDFPTLESLWNSGVIVSYRKVVYGKVRQCQWETPDEEENTQ